MGESFSFNLRWPTPDGQVISWQFCRLRTVAARTAGSARSGPQPGDVARGRGQLPSPLRRTGVQGGQCAPYHRRAQPPRSVRAPARRGSATTQAPRGAVVLILKTRSEHPPLSPSPAGRTLALYFGERFLGVFPQNRLCRAVLLLPSDHAEYLRGRRRQALRTNLRRAARAGIRCETIANHVEALEATSEVLRQRDHEPLSDAEVTRLTDAWSPIFSWPETMVMVARDRDDRARAVIAAVVDRTTCLIKVAVASSHEARWALHDHLVRILDRPPRTVPTGRGRRTVGSAGIRTRPAALSASPRLRTTSPDPARCSRALARLVGARSAISARESFRATPARGSRRQSLAR